MVTLEMFDAVRSTRETDFVFESENKNVTF